MMHPDFIPVIQLCDQYVIEKSLFAELNNAGLIEVTIIEKTECLHKDRLWIFEKIIRIHKDLNINVEGIDAVMNLLERVEQLNKELQQIKKRLELYE